MKCTKAIIPVAGYGTRRLPITKAIEKCMMPLLNRPIIDYVIEDVKKAGITDVYFVISDGATQLRSYYERNLKLETYLTRNGKSAMIDSITPPEGLTFHYIEQDSEDPRYGTTVPVWLCRDYVAEDEAVLVIMGDQCLYRQDGGSEAADLMETVDAAGMDAGMIGVEVPWEEVSKYGVIETSPEGKFIAIHDRPSREEAPSNLNNASFYILPADFFNYVEADMARPHDGEYMLTDAINAFVADGRTIATQAARGKYLDCGTVEGWVAANEWLLRKTT